MIKSLCLVGGNGFIGQNIINDYSKKFNITSLVRKDFLDNPDVNFSVYEKNGFKIIQEKNFDYIFYMLGSPITKKNKSSDLFTYDSNFNESILKEFLDTAKNSTAKIIFCSSGACGAKSADDISVYAQSKINSEKILKLFSLKNSVSVLVLRFFSLFGRYNYKQLIYDATNKILDADGQIEMINPNSKRDFLFVDHALKIAFTHLEKSNEMFEVIDIGSGSLTSVISIYEIIMKILSKPCIIKSVEEVDNFNTEPANLSYINLLENDININLESDISKTVEWIINE